MNDSFCRVVKINNPELKIITDYDIGEDQQMQAEIEVLKNALADKHSQLLAMENACLQESDRQVELEDSIIAWQDKYERLYESHKRVQKVNQNLEDKLLKLVDRNSGERAQLTSDVATLSVRLAQANYNIQNLKREIAPKRSLDLALESEEFEKVGIEETSFPESSRPIGRGKKAKESATCRNGTSKIGKSV
ncbi:uncharacterized protein LOC129760923 [Uranotaenia lowii]|uniref:uncharacterized protein LOC129760923 n=2 Tax=Uranotaenia lowii TaxID=190385 RepID=UPI00247AD162|nr:uncharacterized protein LOC129760923 [Uranotaenia lowii]